MIPQFKLSHEHKKRQQFSVYKPEEEKKKQMLRSQSETQKYYFFVNPIIIHLPIKKKIEYYNINRKTSKILIRSATQPRNDKHLFLIPTYLFSSKKIRIFFSKIPKFCGKKHNFSQCSTYVERQKYFRPLKFQASRRLKKRRQILMSSINMH